MNMHHVDEHELIQLTFAYQAAAKSFASAPDETTLARLDASYCVLRIHQCELRPGLASRLDALGLAACDMIDALLPQRPGAHDALALLHAHEARSVELLEEIADASCAV